MTRIGEKLMSKRMMERRWARAAGQHRKPQQIDLFESDPGGGIIGVPAWLELPAETRNALTSLMVRLILEHASQCRMSLKTEASHDV
jgi:hypothetical protein